MPAVLVKDAQRHGLRVRPIDIQVSDRACTIEHEVYGALSLRMGLGYAKGPNAKQRRLRFRCKSAAINGELKYLCWKKFSGGEWRSTQEISRVHRMIHWLNSMPISPSSLLEKDFSAWRDLYRAYLSELGQYKTGTTSRMDGKQRPQITGRDSAFISTLRQACILLRQAYDLRPDREKDIWELAPFYMQFNQSYGASVLALSLPMQPLGPTTKGGRGRSSSCRRRVGLVRWA